MTWQRTRLKYLAAVPITNGLGEAGAFDNPDWPRYVRTTDIKGPRALRTDVFASLPNEIAAKALLRRGDIVMTAAGATVGKSLLYGWDEPACYAGYLARFRPASGVDPRFVSYWTESTPYLDQIASGKVVSTIDNFSAGKYQNLRIGIPAFPEQRAIADYLDHETAGIDALVAARRRQVDLIDERITAAIWNSATKGLRHAARAPSGLDWVGDMPRHWALPSVGANFDIQLGKMLNQDAAQSGDQFPYLRNVNVQWDRIDLDDLNEMHFDAQDRRRYQLVSGDLIVCEGGEVGRAALWEGTINGCYYQKALHRVRPRRDANARYLMYALWAAASQGVFENEGNTSTIVHLTAEKLRAHRLPWPPRAEQDEIVDALDHVRRESQRMAVVLESQIEVLLERRQAVITAAVTGQLEIPRGAQ